jgi:hypothetical protein
MAQGSTGAYGRGEIRKSTPVNKASGAYLNCADVRHVAENCTGVV